MVSPIKFMRVDPNKTKSRNRGAGYYYKRSSVRKNWYSKFTETADGMKKSQETRFAKPYRHTGDASPSRKTTKKLGRKTIKGFF